MKRLYPAGSFTIINGMICRPELYRLHWFRGENSLGTWTLDIRDDTAANAGTLNSWSLEVCEEPALTGTVVYSEDFEANNGGYTHSGTCCERVGMGNAGDSGDDFDCSFPQLRERHEVLENRS